MRMTIIPSTHPINDSISSADMAEPAEETQRLQMYDEVVEFLNHSRVDVRVEAADIIAGLTVEPHFIETCISNADLSRKATRRLLENLGDTRASISSQCLAALLNMSEIPSISRLFVQKIRDVVIRLINPGMSSLVRGVNDEDWNLQT